MNASPPRSSSPRTSLARRDGAQPPLRPGGARSTPPRPIPWRWALVSLLAVAGLAAQDAPTPPPVPTPTLASAPTPSPSVAKVATESPAAPSASTETNAAPTAASDSAIAQVPAPADSSPNPASVTDKPAAALRSERDSGRSRRSDRRRDRGDNGGSASASTTSTNGAATAREGTDFESFQLIPDRNIFNPNRSARASRTNREPPPRETRVDTLALVGSMSYTKGDFAFFDGSSSEFRRVLKAGDSIAGFQLRSIGRNSVQLESAGKTQELAIGSHFRREEAGEWQLVPLAANAPSPASAATPTSTRSHRPPPSLVRSNTNFPSTASLTTRPSRAVQNVIASKNAFGSWFVNCKAHVTPASEVL